MILLDPWWNATLEDQAFGRVARRGQAKTCYLVRILTTSDMDTKLAEMQDVKTKHVNHTLNDQAVVEGDLVLKDETMDEATISELITGEKSKGPKKRRAEAPEDVKETTPKRRRGQAS